jgi:hypothetical protein
MVPLTIPRRKVFSSVLRDRIILPTLMLTVPTEPPNRGATLSRRTNPNGTGGEYV